MSTPTSFKPKSIQDDDLDTSNVFTPSPTSRNFSIPHLLSLRPATTRLQAHKKNLSLNSLPFVPREGRIITTVNDGEDQTVELTKTDSGLSTAPILAGSHDGNAELSWRKTSLITPTTPVFPALSGSILPPGDETPRPLESPRRKARPSPIQVPGVDRKLGERPLATSTGIISARRKLSLSGNPPSTAGMIGGDRKKASDAPKSAAANFAMARGIRTVTVRTVLPLSPTLQSPPSQTGLDSALYSASSRSEKSTAPFSTGQSSQGSANRRQSTTVRALGGPATAALRSSRTVEVDYLRNEMEKAMKEAGVSASQDDKAIVRSDIILCKFYHTPGLTCTSRPCRFTHEYSPSTTPLTANFPQSADSTETSRDSQGEEAIEELVEIVELFPMSGGGAGAGSKYSKNKYKTVHCRDWEKTGSCPYGEYCSFIHDEPTQPFASDEKVTATGEPAESEDSLAARLTKLSVQEEAMEKSASDDKPEVAEKKSDPEVRPRTLANAKANGRPKSFIGSNIVVPDLRWTKDDGLTVSNPATGTKPDFRDEAGKLVETLSTTPIIATPAQYASVPPQSAWTLGPPKSLQPDSASKDASPYLPISAYTFSTDSTPPITPHREGSDGDESEETVLPECERPHKKDDAQIHVETPYHGIAQPDYHTHDGFDASAERSLHLAQMYGMQPSVHDMGMYPWPIENVYPQAMSAAWEAVMKRPGDVANPEEETRKLAAQTLARLAKGPLPPQVVQSRVNYRTKPCKYYAEGECPRGDSCTYLHDPSNKGIPTPKPVAAERTLRKEPCKFFNSVEGCKGGEDCPFLHVLAVPFGTPLMLRPRPWRTRPCRHFQNGSCLAGEQCHFAHVLENAPLSQTASKSKKPCRFVETEAGCKLGDRCTFSHEAVPV